MQRSELVTVPSFSPQVRAGSIRSAKAVLSVATQSETATKSHLSKPSRTKAASGMLTAGLVAITHSALILPSRTA